MILELIRNGASFHFRGKDGLTALHRAAMCANYKAMLTLLRAGASPNYRDAKAHTHTNTPTHTFSDTKIYIDTVCICYICNICIYSKTFELFRLYIYSAFWVNCPDQTLQLIDIGYMVKSF